MAQEDLSASFHSSTETLSSQVRYVNYGLIAVVWVLCGNAVSGLKTDNNGLILFFIVLSLSLDMCQYIWTSFAIWFHNRLHNLPAGVAADIAVPKHDYIAIVTWAFYVAKIIACLTACVLVAVRLI